MRQLPDLAKHLKDGVTVEKLEVQARAMSDTTAAEEMQKAKRKLFTGSQQRRTGLTGKGQVERGSAVISSMPRAKTARGSSRGALP